MSFPRRTTIAVVVLVTAAAATYAVALAPAAEQDGARHHGCTREFDETVERYITTTQQRDVAGFASVLDRDVITVFRPGDVLYGKRETMGFIRDFFADPNWTQTFRVITRFVKNCQTAFVLFDSVYTEAGKEPLPLVIGVSFTRRGGRWLAVHNQDSQGPAKPPNPPQGG